jgi:DNA repair photolyase
MELDAWLAQDLTSEETKEAYQYFMRPEPKDVRSDLLRDEVTGQRYRMMSIGMVRNARDDQKRVVKVYLDPLPHIRIENGKPLQGWYKGKTEPKGVRARPCFTDAILTEPYGGFCLPPDALVETPTGPRRIADVRVGDLVVGQVGGRLVPAQVLATVNRWCDEGLLTLTLRNGESVRVTAEHPVYSLTRGDYVPAGKVRVGEEIETRAVQELREAHYRLEGPLADRGGAGAGAEGRGLRRPPASGSGAHQVARVDRDPTPLRVYDIQTTTENFYVRGDSGTRSFHVHNCAVGCRFCYINSGFRGYRGTGLISVPVDYGTQVRSMLRKMRTSAAGYFSSFTDPFLPLEDVYHNTQRGAEAFAELGLPVFFLSRLKYPEWAKALLTQNKYSYAQKSINAADERTWRLLSPGAATLAEHMDDIRELRRRGVYVSIQVNPVVPGVVTHDGVEATFDMLAAAGANHVIVKFVEAGYSWAPAMVERIRKAFGPERGGAFARLFTQNIGGQKTVAEEYRMEGHIRYKRAATRLGMTYATCYEYRTELGPNGKPVDKVGVSVGRDFTTADQCHGQRVPMFSRANHKEPFREVEACPPTGCLYCADDNAGAAKCGSETFGAAPALRAGHLQESIAPGAGGDALGKRRLPVLG